VHILNPSTAFDSTVAQEEQALQRAAEFGEAARELTGQRMASQWAALQREKERGARSPTEMSITYFA
jgi:hypothetical protein